MCSYWLIRWVFWQWDRVVFADLQGDGTGSRFATVASRKTNPRGDRVASPVLRPQVEFALSASNEGLSGVVMKGLVRNGQTSRFGPPFHRSTSPGAYPVNQYVPSLAGFSGMIGIVR